MKLCWASAVHLCGRKPASVFASLTQTHGDYQCVMCAASNVFCFFFLCEYIVRVCMCLCVWCMTQWVSWVCWRCLPKLQHGWRFSTNPASLEGLLILTTQFFPIQPAIISERERMRDRYTDSLCTHFALTPQTEITLFTSPWEVSCKCSANTQMSCILNSIIPLFCLVLCHLVSFLFPPFLFHIPPVSLQRGTADVSSQEALCTSECHK